MKKDIEVIEDIDVRELPPDQDSGGGPIDLGLTVRQILGHHGVRN
jgi:hypothetical protein